MNVDGNYIGETAWLYGANEAYLAEMMERWQQDPSSVGKDWDRILKALNGDILPEGPGDTQKDDHKGPSWARRKTRVVGSGKVAMSDSLTEAIRPEGGLAEILHQLKTQSTVGPSSDRLQQATLDSIRAIMLIRAYRMRGHMAASLDPLGLAKRPVQPELDPETYGFTPADYDRPIFINYYLGLESASIREIINICQETYCHSIGVEFMHIQDAEEKSWVQEHVEGTRNRKDFTNMGRRAILERLTHADAFETYLDKRFRGTKRFGLDGGESLIPALEQILKRGAQLGIEEVVIGMAHRGRLNVLANIMGKPYHQIFSEFQGMMAIPDDLQISGDVKYHLGTSADRQFDDKTVHLSLTANPSHLECVNTVVLGKVRAKQDQRNDVERSRVMGLLLHGDAAFIGQGIVAETFLLSQLDGYATGGTIHVCINNQIGFTTAPAKSRSSPYPSDMAKTIDAPVFHVNGDDPEACVHVAKLAVEYRQKFKKDVVIDLWCYRRHGHNEGDEPMFTQPLMYKTIKDHPRSREVYANQLVAMGEIKPQDAERVHNQFNEKLDEAFDFSKSFKPNKADWLEGKWSGISLAGDYEKRRGETGVARDVLIEVGEALSYAPANLTLNSKIVRQLEQKRKMISSGEGIDWGTAEALAFGTLLCESTAVRLSGEDCERGTFSHRHSVLVDQEVERRYIPLNNIRMGQAHFEVIDSPLSEFGLLGFEYGYATAEPHALVVWEAQFGDFANGAQVIIDQFIASGESKWLRMCGLVLLLPHGYEGQGPEHSSARLERYLQSCADDNWQVCNCTTPANYFHALRRQMRRNFRKPLVMMTPKSLLRHKLCVSKLDDFCEGTSFHRVLVDHAEISGNLVADEKIKRLVICTGKVYFDLREKRDELGLDDVYLLRMEQLYPFPQKSLQEQINRFPKAEIIWCQEEPENMGAWFYVDRLLEQLVASSNRKGIAAHRPRYAGRRAAASPATGSAARHIEEQKNLVLDALKGSGI